MQHGRRYATPIGIFAALALASLTMHGLTPVSAATSYGRAGAWSDQVISTLAAGAPFDGASNSATSMSADGSTLAYAAANGTTNGSLVVRKVSTGATTVISDLLSRPMTLSDSGDRVAYTKTFSGVAVADTTTGTQLFSAPGIAVTLSGNGARVFFVDDMRQLMYADVGDPGGPHLVLVNGATIIVNSLPEAFADSTGAALIVSVPNALDPADANGFSHTYRIDIASGTVLRIFAGSSAMLGNYTMAMSSSRRWAVIKRWSGSSPTSPDYRIETFRVDLTGVEPPLVIPKISDEGVSFHGSFISDDGRTFWSLLEPFGIGVVDLATGNSTPLPGLTPGAMDANAHRMVAVSDGQGSAPIWDVHLLDKLDVATFVSTSPVRILETRLEYGLKGYSGATPDAGQIVQLVVTGSLGGAGSTLTVPADARAVALTVTATRSTRDGFVTVYPCGQAVPNASNLSVAAGKIVANLVMVRPGDDGKVCLFTYGGGDLTADIAGYWPGGSRFTSVQPERLLETRSDYGQRGYIGGAPSKGSTIELTVTGVGSAAVAVNASAVALNVTGTRNIGDGFITVYPCGQQLPDASSVNLDRGSTNSNLVISRVGANGKVCLYTYGGGDIVADLVAYWPADSDFAAITPVRVLETRFDHGVKGYPGLAPPRAGGVVAVDVSNPSVIGALDVPTAVAINVTATRAPRDGFITAYPCGEPVPDASNINVVAGGTAADLVISRVGANGKVCLYTYGGVDLVADVVGSWPM